jgi:hypothetical protein
MDLQAFLDELVCLPLIRGKETILISILFITPVADLSDPVSPLQGTEMKFTTPSQGAGMQVYNFFSVCRNAYFRMQEW